MFRALKTAPSCRTLSDVLSRLVETVGEMNDDMQGYVTEILLTLQKSVELMEVFVIIFLPILSNYAIISDERTCDTELYF